jgi:hypothetical protein
MKTTLLTLIFTLFLSTFLYGQKGNATVIFYLKSSKGYHKFIDITCIDKATKNEYKGKTDALGKAQVVVPSYGDFDVKFSNSDKTRDFQMPGYDGLVMELNFQYEGGMEDWSKKYPPSATQIKEWKSSLLAYPDTTFYNFKTVPTSCEERLSIVTLKLVNIDNLSLTDETIWIKGKTSNKYFKTTTNQVGKAFFLLPKGESYVIEFTLDKNFSSFEIPLQLGSLKSDLSFSYLGTKEILKRKKEKEERLKAEEERRKKEEAEFIARAEKMKKSIEEARIEEIKRFTKSSSKDNVVLKVLERNKHWKNKLVVCDLTGSMSPYASQLAEWYALNHMKEQNLQFVFFNDGDNKPNSSKVIGNTGGIYYSKSKGIDSLYMFMAKVISNGNGGDGPENNMEALIKGTQLASNFKEIIMIADNYAPVKDIELLIQFKLPVRIILCGLNYEVEEDYLRIAKETKGSIHTIEQDILNLSEILEGKTITIQGVEYKLMNGKFIRLTRS